MIRIAKTSQFSSDDKELLAEFFNANSFEFVVESEGRPVWVGVGGGIVYREVAYLIITIAGAGAVLMLKSFLQSIGTELGKKVVRHFKKKARDEGPRPEDIYILFEINSDTVILIPLVDINEPGFAERMQIPETIEKTAAQISKGTKNIFYASFDKNTNLWCLNELKGGPALLRYKNETGIVGIIPGTTK